MAIGYQTPERGTPAVSERPTMVMGKPITSDMVLKTVGAILLAVTGWFLSHAYDRLDGIERRQNDFDGRLIRNEERQGETSRSIAEIKDDVKDIKRAIVRP